jgi:FrmR/RcnR family transcriptional regulator, repressor of frmRAB operon
MVHVVTERQKLLNRIRRLRGQIEAIERALDSDAGCTQVCSC